MITTPKTSGASSFACLLANRIMSLDGFDTVRDAGLLAEVARIIDSDLNFKPNILGTVKPEELIQRFQEMGLHAENNEEYIVKVWSRKTIEELQAIRNEVEGR